MEKAYDESDGFQARLFQFPCLFDHSFLQDISQSRLKLMNIWQQSQNQHNIDNDDPNFSVLLLWLLYGHQDEAKVLAQDLLQRQPTDLIALSSLAFISWRLGDQSRAEELLATLVALRDGDYLQYSDLLKTAKTTLVDLYKYCKNHVKPYVLSDLMESMLALDPGNTFIKFRLVKMLHFYTHINYSGQYPHADLTRAVRGSVELYVQLKNSDSVDVDIRGKAASSLGSLLARLDDVRLKEVATQEMSRHNIRDPGQCFEEAVNLSPGVPEVLIRAGKAMQYIDAEKSRSMLKRAVSLAPNNARAHHYLGLTLRRLALLNRNVNRPRSYPNPRHQASNSPFQERGGGRAGNGNTNESRSSFLIRIEKQRMNRNDQYVNEAMEHFEKALELSVEGHNSPIRFTLITMHTAFGECREALQLVSSTMDFFINPIYIGQALDKAWVIYRRLVQGETDANRRAALRETQLCLDNLVVINACLVLEQCCALSRHLRGSIDEHFFSLSGLFALVDQRRAETSSSSAFRGRAEQTPTGLRLSKEELRVLDCLQACADQPPLMTMMNRREPLTLDLTDLERRSQDLFTQKRFDDAAMLLSLRKLLKTVDRNELEEDQQPTPSSNNGLDPEGLLVKSCAMAACRRLQEGARDSFQAALAKEFFRRAFQRYVESQQNEPGIQDSADLEQVLVVGVQSTDAGKLRVDAVNKVLHNVCGLTVTCLDPGDFRDVATRGELTTTATKARLILFVVADEGVSSDFMEIVTTILSTAGEPRNPALPGTSEDRQSTSNAVVVTMLLDGASLPTSLRSYHSFTWQQDRLLFAEMSPMTTDGALAVCQLFAAVLGFQLDIPAD